MVPIVRSWANLLKDYRMFEKVDILKNTIDYFDVMMHDLLNFHALIQLTVRSYGLMSVMISPSYMSARF